MGYTTNFDGKVEIFPAVNLEDLNVFKTQFDFREWGGCKIKDAPKAYCDWEISEDGKFLEHNGDERSLVYIRWLEFIIENFFVPSGYMLQGEILWDGEERGDIGTITVANNKVIVTEGK